MKCFLGLLIFPYILFGAIVNDYFNYDLHLSSLPGKNQRVMICFHGYGGNYEIAYFLRSLNMIDSTLVSFNLPDHDLTTRKDYNPQKASLGTIQEILPALYIMKHIILDQQIRSVDLYGFSAGGAVLINLLGVLNSSRYEEELLKIGIKSSDKKILLTAVQNGIVILDAPLKSIEEIIAYRGSSQEFEKLAKNYRDNHMRPIDSLKFLQGLSLNILLHFQEKDEILSNRDDALYIARLQAVQSNDKVKVIIADEGGHNAAHRSLWIAYKQMIEGSSSK